MTTPDRQDATADAMLTVESRRDTLDALRDEFTSGVATRSQQLKDQDEKDRQEARRDEAEDEYDDRHESLGDDLHSGMGY